MEMERGSGKMQKIFESLNVRASALQHVGIICFKRLDRFLPHWLSTVFFARKRRFRKSESAMLSAYGGKQSMRHPVQDLQLHHPLLHLRRTHPPARAPLAPLVPQLSQCGQLFLPTV